MYNKVLLTVDLSDEESWTKAAPTAVEMCEVFGAELHVMTVVPDMGFATVPAFFPDNYESEMVAGIASDLEKLVVEILPDNLMPKLRVGSGSIYKEIIRIADENDIDLIVMSSHRPEMGDYLIGPNAARVMRHAKQSVFVVRD